MATQYPPPSPKPWERYGGASAPARAPQGGGVVVRPAQTPQSPPTGFRPAPGGGLTYVPGGPDDPAVIRRNAEARDIPKQADAAIPVTPERNEQIRQEALRKIQLARRLRTRSRDDQFVGGFWQNLQGLRGTPAYDFNADTDTLKNAQALERLMSMTAANGGKNPLTPVSNTDFAAIAASSTNLDPGQNDDQFQQNLGITEQNYADLYRHAGGADLEADLAALGTGAQVDPQGATVDRSPRLQSNSQAPREAPPTISTDAEVRFSTHTDKRYAAELRAAFRNGAPTMGQLEAIRQRYIQNGFNYGPLNPAQWQPLIDRRRKGQAVDSNIGVPQSGSEQRNQLQQTLSGIAGSPVGGFTTGVANGVTMGGLDELTAGVNSLVNGTNYQSELDRANMAKGLIRDANPGAEFAGEIGGAMLTGGGANSLMSRAGVRLATGAFSPGALAVDALSGGTYGALENNDNRAGGALIGAATGPLGGAVGRGVANGVAPRVAPQIRALINEDIPVPVADILGQGGPVGQFVKRASDTLGATPLGGANRRNQQRAVQGLNRAQVNRALRPLGETLPAGVEVGNDAIRYTQQRLGDVYTAEIPNISGSSTPGFQRRVQRTVARAGIPDDVEAARLLRGALDETLRPFDQATGAYTGRGWRDSHETLGAIARQLRNSPDVYERRAGVAVSRLRDQLRALVARDNPQQMNRLMQADRGYASLARLEHAASSPTASARGGVVTAAELNSATGRADPSRRRKAVGDALDQDLASAAQRVMGNSGTQGGSAGVNTLLGIGSTIGGLMTGHPAAYVGAGAFGLNSAFNSTPVQALLRAGLTREAGPRSQYAAQALRRAGRATGAVSADNRGNR